MSIESSTADLSLSVPLSCRPSALMATRSASAQNGETKRCSRRETVSSVASPPSISPTSAPTRKKDAPSVPLDPSWCCAPPHRRTNVHPSQEKRGPQAEPIEPTSDTSYGVSPVRKQNLTINNPNGHQSAQIAEPVSETNGICRFAEQIPVISSPFEAQISPATTMHSSSSFSSAFPSSYTKFNSMLNAGLLNPMSPQAADKAQSSPTLFEMMSNEPDSHATDQPSSSVCNGSNSGNGGKPPSPAMTVQEKHLVMQERVNEILGSSSPGNLFNDEGSSDVKLTLRSKDGFGVSVSVHRRVLVEHSRFFASKLSVKWSRQQRTLPHLVEIADCDDVESYLETLQLMYSDNLKRRLMREDVSEVLQILKVSTAIVFDAAILACMEYLEAAPWTQDEEEKVAAMLSQLQLDSTGTVEVLKRLCHEMPAPSNDEIVVKLLGMVLQGKDYKARRDMKELVSKMLRENSCHNRAAANENVFLDVSKESLYATCNSCLDLLFHNFAKATGEGFMDQSNLEERRAVVNEISRQSDNLNWVLEILIDRQIAEDFARIWASQVKLAKLHSEIPTMYRYEVSKLTARVCVAIGKGQILAPKDVRVSLLQTWLEPLYDDFGWMRRGCKSMDRNLIEEGLGQTILTLPLSQQQAILMNWFNRFLNSGDECPNIQRAFEVWWRRAFWRRNGDVDQRQQLQITAMRIHENGG